MMTPGGPSAQDGPARAACNAGLRRAWDPGPGRAEREGGEEGCGKSKRKTHVRACKWGLDWDRIGRKKAERLTREREDDGVRSGGGRKTERERGAD